MRRSRWVKSGEKVAMAIITHHHCFGGGFPHTAMGSEPEAHIRRR